MGLTLRRANSAPLRISSRSTEEILGDFVHMKWRKSCATYLLFRRESEDESGRSQNYDRRRARAVALSYRRGRVKTDDFNRELLASL